MHRKQRVIFAGPISEQIQNFKTGEKCLLLSSESKTKLGRGDIDKIISICNQKPAYEMLFRQRLEGKAYGYEQAHRFVKRIIEGWVEQKSFAFLIRNSSGELIGVVDIKSNDLKRAEVGYWSDQNHSGIMSNVVAKLIELAKNAGYKILFATTRLDNERSQKVLLRNGFLNKGEVEKPGLGTRLLFERELQ
ncbi:MAG: putative acetyltransferase [Microgenomates group bacterium GW2011_GWF2_47_9]|nr:MAG: putative acetyltransferase [Microgenomates group bacterium GW2011_GWF2_47_9]